MYWAPLLFNRLTREVRFGIWRNQAQNLTSSLHPTHPSLLSLLCSLQAPLPAVVFCYYPLGSSTTNRLNTLEACVRVSLCCLLCVN